MLQMTREHLLGPFPYAFHDGTSQFVKKRNVQRFGKFERTGRYLGNSCIDLLDKFFLFYILKAFILLSIDGI